MHVLVRSFPELLFRFLAPDSIHAITCLSSLVCPSVTLVDQSKMNVFRIMQFSPSPIPQVFAG